MTCNNQQTTIIVLYIMLFSPTQILNLNAPIFKLKCSDTSQKVIKMLGEKVVTAEYPATWSALLNNKGYAVRGK